MRARNFNPEWGYLAPAPSFARTVRIVIVAAAVGATAGAAVVFSLVDRPSAEETVAARTLVQPVDSLSAPTPAAVASPSQHLAADGPQPLLPADGHDARHASHQPANAQSEGRLAHIAASESSAVSTAQHPTSAAALAEAPAAADVTGTENASEPATAQAQTVPPQTVQPQRKIVRKPVVNWRGLPPQPPPPRGPLALLRPFGSQY